MLSISDYGTGLKLIFGPESEGFTNHVPITLPPARKAGRKIRQRRDSQGRMAGGGKNGTSSAAMANFDYAGMLSEFILLGNAALRACNDSGESPRLEWDGPAMHFTNAPTANAHLTKSYRAGWELEGV